jgi:hypothetical protein
MRTTHLPFLKQITKTEDNEQTRTVEIILLDLRSWLSKSRYLAPLRHSLSATCSASTAGELRMPQQSPLKNDRLALMLFSTGWYALDDPRVVASVLLYRFRHRNRSRCSRPRIVLHGRLAGKPEHGLPQLLAGYTSLGMLHRRDSSPGSRAVVPGALRNQCEVQQDIRGYKKIKAAGCKKDKISK